MTLTERKFAGPEAGSAPAAGMRQAGSWRTGAGAGGASWQGGRGVLDRGQGVCDRGAAWYL